MLVSKLLIELLLEFIENTSTLQFLISIIIHYRYLLRYWLCDILTMQMTRLHINVNINYLYIPTHIFLKIV